MVNVDVEKVVVIMPEQVNKYDKITEQECMYFSKSKKKYIPISEMNEVHIKNAILDILTEMIKHLKTLDITEFVNDPPLDIYMVPVNILMDELSMRVNKEE